MLGKGDIAQQVAQQTGMRRSQAAKAVDAVIDVVQGAVAKGEQVRITGFGSFRVTETKARKGRNPRTGQAIDIKAGRRVSFSPGSKLVESVRTGSPASRTAAATRGGAAGGGAARGGRGGGGGASRGRR
jgi:DNA-binding protein HU-beta